MAGIVAITNLPPRELRVHLQESKDLVEVAAARCNQPVLAVLPVLEEARGTVASHTG